MTDREKAGQKALEFSENLWKRGDFWEFETSDYERARFARTVQVLQGARFSRGVELGCGAGYFTRLLAPYVDQPRRLRHLPDRDRARPGRVGPPARSTSARQRDGLRVARRRAVGSDRDERHHLLLGWLYSFFDIAWFASELHERSGRAAGT